MHRTKFHLLGALPTAARGAESVADGAWDNYGAVTGRPKFISLFSGAMGLDLGLEAAGFECAGCLELDPWACKTIRDNRPCIPLIEDDIRNWHDGAALLAKLGVSKDQVALVVGGPPCPSFSTAGRRQSFNDPRGQVMFDFLKLPKLMYAQDCQDDAGLPCACWEKSRCAAFYGMIDVCGEPCLGSSASRRLRRRCR